MTTQELVDGFIKHIEQHRRYEQRMHALAYELEKWQAVAVSGIHEEALVAALNAYDLEHENDIG